MTGENSLGESLEKFKNPVKEEDCDTAITVGPDGKPIVIVDNFKHCQKCKERMIYKKTKDGEIAYHYCVDCGIVHCPKCFLMMRFDGRFHECPHGNKIDIKNII